MNKHRKQDTELKNFRGWFQMAAMTVWSEERCRLVLTRVAWCLFGSFCLWAGMVGIKEVGHAEFINERQGKQ